MAVLVIAEATVWHNIKPPAGWCAEGEGRRQENFDTAHCTGAGLRGRKQAVDAMQCGARMRGRSVALRCSGVLGRAHVLLLGGGLLARDPLGCVINLQQNAEEEQRKEEKSVHQEVRLRPQHGVRSSCIFRRSLRFRSSTHPIDCVTQTQRDETDETVRKHPD
ncbi:hypothetical protein BD289DRAFT_237161 [Coniella lustricola]|uniref:Uncharacterized protein n=1 Tax=Coniella lustricola TaxID=2025994 RepID=A0A2T3AL43_9PEZI|nr:hypothetical protein BD289DRAFT_237161 [Coniella lustricola]